MAELRPPVPEHPRRKVKIMRPDQCGFGRSLESLHPGDRAVVEGFAAFLAGEVAMVAATGEFVPLERAGEPGVVTRDPASQETPKEQDHG